jgi:uncharacterized protein
MKNRRRAIWFVVTMMLVTLTIFMLGPLDQFSVAALTPEETVLQQAAAADVGLLRQKSWSPYFAGFCIGVLSWFSFLLSNVPLGVSSAFPRMSAAVERATVGKSAEDKEYYQKYPPKWGWELMFVGGLLLGAFLSAVLSGDFRFSFIPATWDQAFGRTFFARWMIAVMGGMIMMIGARWTGGCTSGHGVSGTLQLSVSSWLAVILFFIGGMISYRLLYFFL